MRWIMFLIAVSMSICSLCAAASRTRTIVVSAPECGYSQVPVSALVTPPPGTTGYILRSSDGKDVPCQASVVGSRTKIAWILDDLKMGSSRTYRLDFTDKRLFREALSVRVEKTNGTVDVSISGKPFTTYRFADGPKPYCYPLIGPTGDPVTRSYPMKEVEGETKDHPHHRSWWFTFGSVNGIDFWSESPKAGRTFHIKFEALESGPVMGCIKSLNDWIAPDGSKVCEDVREIIVYRVPDGRLMDFNVTVRATEGPVTFGDTKEGMMGFRVASSMDVDRGGHIVNSRGQKDGDAWGMPAEWCDYYGPVNGKTVGIAILDNPSSFRHPTYWHVRTYGLFAANPFGLKDYPDGKGKDGSYTIPKGGEMRFRYRILIHNGDTEQAGIGAAFDSYAHPPTVTIK